MCWNRVNVLSPKIRRKIKGVLKLNSESEGRGPVWNVFRNGYY